MRGVFITTAVLLCSTYVEQGSSRLRNEKRTETWLFTSADMVSAIQQQLRRGCVYIIDNRTLTFGRSGCVSAHQKEGSNKNFVLFLSRLQWTANGFKILEIFVAARKAGGIFRFSSTRAQTALQIQCPFIRHPFGRQEYNPQNTRGKKYPRDFILFAVFGTWHAEFSTN